MPRRTKIIATIGPASESPAVLRQMVNAGMDVARIGLAHGTLEEALERMRVVRRVAEEEGRRVGVLVDLPGPKVRTASFGLDGVELPPDSVLEIRVGNTKCTDQVIEVDYDNLFQDIAAGDQVALGDGQVLLEVTDVRGDLATAEVLHGNVIRGRPGFRIPSDRLSLSTPTPEDLRGLDAFISEAVDMVAISFVRTGDDVRRVDVEPHPDGPLVIAKIETQAAVRNLEDIIEASAGIMVARGDLGTECLMEETPHLQKRIIRDCIAGGLPVITATQMLDSMVQASTPTRAEVSDVANAVFDGTSAVMLSAETAIGAHPAVTVATMARIAQRADEEFDYVRWGEGIRRLRMTDADAPKSLTDAMTGAAATAANELQVAAIVCISASGFTVRSMARFRPQTAILGFSTSARTVQQLTLSWGVTPILAREVGSYEARVSEALSLAQEADLVAPGDVVAVVAGMAEATDVLRLVRIH
ncbi:pyruvate kinase [Candidatus Poriferisocius sp.]|uniref:pyruvate kinase n=1 Tax=Candidatus Poriferisocius sp. TaxID=3101276 RepID=UPI003B5AC633